jgi:hypothetical protein
MLLRSNIHARSERLTLQCDAQAIFSPNRLETPKENRNEDVNETMLDLALIAGSLGRQDS